MTRLLLGLSLVACGSGAPPRAAPPANEGTAEVCPPEIEPGARFVADETAPTPECYAYDAATGSYACLGFASDNGSADYPEGHYQRQRWIDNPVCGARPSAVPLPEEEWRALGGVRVRYDSGYHEGDASFEYWATLTVECGGRTIDIELDEHVATGEHAIAFTAPGATRHAISITGEDGGEGVYYWTLQTVLLDERTCTVAPLP